MEKVAIYCRLSDEDRDKERNSESESIQNQKSMLVKYCMEKNWDIYKIYCDEDYSGADRTRPEFNEMINACKNGEVTLVLCKTQSRFSRDMEIIEKYIHGKFLEWDIRFVSIVDHADTKIAGNKKARQINGLINEWYLEDLSDNIRRTLNHKKKNGEYTGSFAPYGYMIDPENKNHLIVDPEASEVVKDIFRMYLSGMGYIKIAKELNSLNIPNPTSYKAQHSNYRNSNCENSARSNLWSDSTIYSLLRKEIYTGTLVQGFAHNVSYKNHRRKKVPEDKWIKCPETHEPIISREDFEAVQRMKKSRGVAEKFSGEVYPLSGKVFCEECGSVMWKMSYQSGSNRYKYFRCKTVKISEKKCKNTESIRADLLEKAVIKGINTLLERYYRPEKIEISDAPSLKKLSKLEKSKVELEAYIKKREDNLTKLYEDKLDNLVSRDQYITFSKKFSEEIEKAKQQLDVIIGKIQEINTEKMEVGSKNAVLEKYRMINSLTPVIVNEFVEAIYVSKKKSKNKRNITIKWNI